VKSHIHRAERPEPLLPSFLLDSNHRLSRSIILRAFDPTVFPSRDVASHEPRSVHCPFDIAFIYLYLRPRLAFCRIYDTKWTRIRLSIWQHDRSCDSRSSYKLPLARTADDGQLGCLPKRTRRPIWRLVVWQWVVLFEPK